MNSGVRALEGGTGTSLNKPSKIQDSHNVWLPGPITEGYEVVKGEGRWRLPRLIIQLIEAQQLPISEDSIISAGPLVGLGVGESPTLLRSPW